MAKKNQMRSSRSAAAHGTHPDPNLVNASGTNAPLATAAGANDPATLVDDLTHPGYKMVYDIIFKNHPVEDATALFTSHQQFIADRGAGVIDRAARALYERGEEGRILTVVARHLETIVEGTLLTKRRLWVLSKRRLEPSDPVEPATKPDNEYEVLSQCHEKLIHRSEKVVTWLSQRYPDLLRQEGIKLRKLLRSCSAYISDWGDNSGAEKDLRNAKRRLMISATGARYSAPEQHKLIASSVPAAPRNVEHSPGAPPAEEHAIGSVSPPQVSAAYPDAALEQPRPPKPYGIALRKHKCLWDIVRKFKGREFSYGELKDAQVKGDNFVNDVSLDKWFPAMLEAGWLNVHGEKKTHKTYRESHPPSE